jgi:hypothetical protein
MTQDMLRTLLDDTALQEPEYRGGLSNHLPMALHALAMLDATPASLERFASDYLRRSGIQKLGIDAPSLANWRTALGQVHAYASLRSTFAGLIEQHGPDSVIRSALPHLWPGAGAAAFHGLIRVAHAWEAEHAAELAAALAYWAARWQATPAPVAPRTMPLPEWLAEAERAAIGSNSAAGLIMDRMAEATRSPAFRAHAARLAPSGESVLQAAAWAAQFYADTANFTILHVVTGLRAVQVLSKLSLPPPELWNAVFAAIQSSGFGGRRATDLDDRSWQRLAAEANAAGDEHVIKLVHACKQLDTIQPDARFRLAAVRVLKP